MILLVSIVPSSALILDRHHRVIAAARVAHSNPPPLSVASGWRTGMALVVYIFAQKSSDRVNRSSDVEHGILETDIGTTS